MRHRDEPERRRARAAEHDARRAEAVGDHAGERLRRAPDEVLHGERERERLAAPAEVGASSAAGTGRSRGGCPSRASGSRPPQTRTTVGRAPIGARVDVRTRRIHCVSGDRSVAAAGVGMQRFDVAERRDQRVELRRAELARDLAPARASSAAARRSQRRLARRASARPRACAHRGPARSRRGPRSTSGSRLRDSAVRSSSSARGELGRCAPCPSREQRAQQRELRDAQPRRRHRVVVELRQRARARRSRPQAQAGEGARRRRARRSGMGMRGASVHMHAIGAYARVDGNVASCTATLASICTLFGAIASVRRSRCVAQRLEPLRPALRARDRLVPAARAAPRARSRGIAGSKRRSTLPVARDVVGAPSSSRRRARRGSAAPSAVVSSTLRPHDRHAEHVGLELHQQVVRGRAAVDAQLGQRDAGVLLHRVQHVGALERDRLERRAREVRRRSRRASGRRSRRARTRPSAARRVRRTPARGRRRRCPATLAASASISAARADDLAARRAATARPRRR